VQEWHHAARGEILGADMAVAPTATPSLIGRSEDLAALEAALEQARGGDPVTVLIAGEEDFWGDPGFWIETWTDEPGRPPETQAALMSYEIFGDTSAVERLQLYMRKTVSMQNEDGSPRFDINKPAAGMLNMKKDMGGAACMLALAHMLMARGIGLRLRVIIPAVENAISGASFRPRDVYRSRKGLSVEIGNTDAEGRLILADAIALADEDKPDLIADMATLTGAARVALGTEIPPFYTDDEALAGFKLLSETEGIIPALETAHGVAHIAKVAPKMPVDQIIVMNCSGRGDKDVALAARHLLSSS